MSFEDKTLEKVLVEIKRSTAQVLFDASPEHVPNSVFHGLSDGELDLKYALERALAPAGGGDDWPPALLGRDRPGGMLGFVGSPAVNEQHGREVARYVAAAPLVAELAETRKEREDFGRSMDLAVERERTERAEALRQQEKALREGWRANDAEQKLEEAREALAGLESKLEERRQARYRLFEKHGIERDCGAAAAYEMARNFAAEALGALQSSDTGKGEAAKHPAPEGVSEDAWNKLMNAPIMTPGHVYVEKGDGTGEWMDGRQVARLLDALDYEHRRGGLIKQIVRPEPTDKEGGDGWTGPKWEYTRSGPDAHRWVLVSEEDELETEVCSQCGAQRNKEGPIEERATITGGWPSADCNLVALVGDPEAAFQALPEAERKAYEDAQPSPLQRRRT